MSQLAETCCTSTWNRIVQNVTDYCEIANISEYLFNLDISTWIKCWLPDSGCSSFYRNGFSHIHHRERDEWNVFLIIRNPMLVISNARCVASFGNMRKKVIFCRRICDNAHFGYSRLPRKLETKLIARNKRIQHQLPSICFVKNLPLSHVYRLPVAARDGTSTT